jgi:hypothetical protein
VNPIAGVPSIEGRDIEFVRTGTEQYVSNTTEAPTEATTERRQYVEMAIATNDQWDTSVWGENQWRHQLSDGKTKSRNEPEKQIKGSRGQNKKKAPRESVSYSGAGENKRTKESDLNAYQVDIRSQEWIVGADPVGADPRSGPPIQVDPLFNSTNPGMNRRETNNKQASTVGHEEPESMELRERRLRLIDSN